MKKSIILIILFFAVSYFAKSQNCTNCDGSNTISTANYSSAVGITNTSTGLGSFAAGKYDTVTGNFSVGFGFRAVATGETSFAAGGISKASGIGSMSFGHHIVASGTKSFVIGTGGNSTSLLKNTNPNSLMIGFGSNKPTLFIGTAPENGKTGTIGIGDISEPSAKLHIKSDYGEDAAMLIEPYEWNSNSWAEIRIGNNSNGIKTSYSYGLQFKTDRNYLFNSSHAKVGIGIDVPHEKLEVNGNIKQSAGFYLITDKVKASDASGLKLQDKNGDGLIVKNGKIGIGLSGPVYDLDVNGVISTSAFRLHEGSATDGYVLQNNASGDAHWVDPMTLDVDDGDWTTTGPDIYRATGNVGIGNPPANTKLDVTGDVRLSGSLLLGSVSSIPYPVYKFQVKANSGEWAGVIENTHMEGKGLKISGAHVTYPNVPVLQTTNQGDQVKFTVLNNGNVGIGTSLPGEAIDMKKSLAGTDKRLGIRIVDEGVFPWYAGMDLNNFSDNTFVITDYNKLSTDPPFMAITKYGEVGIGKVPETGVMLDVEGTLKCTSMNIEELTMQNLYVNNKIEAAEIEVKNMTEWKDYVFEEDYPLLSLTAVEHYIKENKHLPDIPSEEDVKENGIDLAEMNALLLQKIEELTLYVIDLEKKINSENCSN